MSKTAVIAGIGVPLAQAGEIMIASWKRSAPVLALGLSLNLALCGCSVPEDGWVGVGRDPDGELRVFVSTCHPMDGATLYYATGSRVVDRDVAVKEWEIDPEARSLTIEWPLLRNDIASFGVEVTDSAPLPDTKVLTISAWTNDNSHFASGPFAFTTLGLDALQPGEILVGDGEVVDHVQFVADTECFDDS